jgi:hypothetical protein
MLDTGPLHVLLSTSVHTIRFSSIVAGEEPLGVVGDGSLYRMGQDRHEM